MTLTLRLDVNSALGSVLTGVLVLFALLGAGLRYWRERGRENASSSPPGSTADAASNGSEQGA